VSPRYDARQTACRPELVPIFLAPPEIPDDWADEPTEDE
jgi:hypothetical protein